MLAARPEDYQCAGGNDGRIPSTAISPAHAGAFLAAARVVAAGVRSPRSIDAIKQNHAEKRCIATGLGVESNSQSSTQLLGSRKHRVSGAWASSELSAGLQAYAGEPTPSRPPARSWAAGLSLVKMPQRAPSPCQDPVGVPVVGSRSAAGSDVGVEHGWSRKVSRSPPRYNVTDGVAGGDSLSRSIGLRLSPGVDAGTEVGSTVGRAKSPRRSRNSVGETARWSDAAAEAVTSAAMESHSKVPVAGRSLPGAVPRWDVSLGRARSASPHSPCEVADAVGGGRPCRQREEINPPYATTDSQGREALMPRQQLREAQPYRDGYDTGFKHIRTFKDSRHYKSCSALNPQSGGHTWDAGLEPHSPFVKEGGDQLRTRRNYKEATASANLARTLRSADFENTSCSGGDRLDCSSMAPPHRPSRRYLRPTSEQPELKDEAGNRCELPPESNADACASGDKPRTTSQETSRRQAASTSRARSSSPNERMRAAGRQTPRHDSAIGMVFRGSDEADFRSHTNLGTRRILANTSPVGAGPLSPRSNIVTEGALGESSPEKENATCERFLGDRRCRSMCASPWASLGSTPWVSPTPSLAVTPRWSPRGSLQRHTMVDQQDNHSASAVHSPRSRPSPPPGPEVRRDAVLFQRKSSQPFSPSTKGEEARFRKREMSQQEYSTKSKSIKPAWRK